MTLTEFLLARIAEDEEGPFFNAWHVRRVRADCEAKRRIVEEHYPLDGGEPEEFPDAECNGCPMPSPCLTVRLLALPYADHPDYHEEWRP